MFSSAWNNKVLNPEIISKYRHLFEMRTPYQASVLDGIQLLANEPLEQEFVDLMKAAGNYNLLEPDNLYSESYSMGCVVLLMGARYKQTPSFKLRINPSEGGLSVSQVIDWARLATGDENNFRVKRVDSKIDLHNVDPLYCMRSIWASNTRAIDDSTYPGETLYLGSSTSFVFIIVYDKATQTKSVIALPKGWTRVEVRRKFEKEDQVSLPAFINSLRSYDPFREVVFINADCTELNSLLKRYRKRVVYSGYATISKTFKNLTNYQQNVILDHLDSMGKVEHLSNRYFDDLNEWLKY